MARIVVYGALLLAVFLGVPYYTIFKHYQLPVPLNAQTNALTGLPQLSEAAILETTRQLSETFGYRTVGTREHALADAWMYDQVQQLAATCPKHLQCETWRQVGSGTHRFDMMGKVLFKTYRNLTNIIVRVSDGTPQGKENAVLVNSHLDSTLPSPGAADDALSAGVMLDIMRVLTQTPDWKPQHAIIFLFNNAEESLQDGSHLYSTQHETRHTVRAAMNLEAAGSTGPELLFQATSEEMIHAYSHSTKPYGTIVANEIFSSGIILSDTDFRQFEEYLNVTGLDMAVVGNSYVYHTRKDIVANIEPGVAHHMAENALEILKYLTTSKSSPLASLKTSGYHKPSTTFFSLLGSVFFQYSSGTALIMHGVLVGLVLVTMALTRTWTEIRSGVVAVLAAGFGALVGANLLAFFMDRIFDRPLSWFSNEMDTLLLYVPAAFAGALSMNLLVREAGEHAVLAGQIIIQSVSGLLLQGIFGIGSSVVLFISGASLFAAYTLDALIKAFSPRPAPPVETAKPKPKTKGKAAAMAQRYAKKVAVVTQVEGLHVMSYIVGQVMPLILGIEMLLGDLDVFVPLTGRIGREAPAEHIIATIVGLFAPYTLSMALPFVRRASSASLKWLVLALYALTVLSASIFLKKDAFDADHQRRIFVVHMENITSHEFSLNVGAADRAPGMPEFVKAVAATFGVPGKGPVPVVMNDWNTEWDTMYPFSQFVSPYKITLPTPKDYTSSWSERFQVIKTTESVDMTAGSRGLTISVKHPGVIWTVLAFDADVLSWSLGSAPPAGMQRHHIKEASFYGVDEWSLDLVVRGTGPLSFSFVGIGERSMWPGKKHEAEGPAMDLFKVLDPWIDQKTGNAVDALLIGCVGGVVQL
ncbi:hypothetical protein EXIGLDRAFT_726594 [Exidia glandulosa HHB12029]|uniref:Peptide hydrolase n=1 Tax=Exidia glandulosa HHB12029 TaxID=1314781 RepID=A0A165DN33_EXIGL|nr:hypothetical protein EXIGLDRAFT_726594 [Exidia glandulosa HHB12029]